MASTTTGPTFKDMTNATPEEFERDRVELSKPMSPERRAQALAAWARIRAVQQRILERTGGRGISETDVQEALDGADEH
jgi:hypothetical protein